MAMARKKKQSVTSAEQKSSNPHLSFLVLVFCNFMVLDLSKTVYFDSFMTMFSTFCVIYVNILMVADSR